MLKIAVVVRLSKAFDSVNHNLLLVKPKLYGFSTTATNLVSKYLKEQRERVKMEVICSEWVYVMAGVNQGSLLGPLSFMINI